MPELKEKVARADIPQASNETGPSKTSRENAQQHHEEVGSITYPKSLLLLQTQENLD
jgi:hypothetical protein